MIASRVAAPPASPGAGRYTGIAPVSSANLPADRTIRVHNPEWVLLVEVPWTTTKGISRFKLGRPEPARPRSHQPGP